MTQGKADKQAGEKLFSALRELEIQYLNGGHSVQTSIQRLLRDHKFTPANQMASYLLSQSILKKDPDQGSHKKPYYYYNGPRLTVKYCNELIIAMKLDRSVSSKSLLRDTNTYMKDGEIIQGTPFDEKVKVPQGNPILDTQAIKQTVLAEYKQEQLDEAMQIHDDAKRDIDLYSLKLEEAKKTADEYSIIVRYLLPKNPF